MRSCLHPPRYLAHLFLLAALLGCSSEVPFEELMVRGHEALAQGDANRAIVEIKTALQQQPGSADARRVLGEAYLFLQNYSAAADEFERSLRAEFDDETARTFAKTLSRVGEHERLLELYNEGFFQLTESDGEVRAVLARSLLALRDTDAARQMLAEARAAAPANAHVRYTAAEFQARLDKDLRGASLALKQLLAVHPSLTDAWSLLGTLSLAQGQYEIAVAAFTRALELNPYRLADRLRLATLHVQLGDWNAARPQIDTLAKAASESPEVRYLETRVLLHEGKADAALEKLSASLGLAPNHAPSLLLAAALNADEGNYSTALNQLTHFLRLSPTNARARLLLARIYLQEELAEKAESATRSLLGQNGANAEALQLLGISLALQKNHGEAANAFRRALATAPGSLDIRLLLGTQLLLAEQPDTAIEVLTEARDVWPEDLRARIRLVQAYVFAGRETEARVVAEAAVDDFPDSALAHSLVGQVEVAGDDRDAATFAFNHALTLEPDNRVAGNALAALAVSKDNGVVARRIFRDYLAAAPDDLPELTEISAADTYRRDLASLESLYREDVAADPDALGPRLNLARAALLDGRPEEAAEALAEVRDTFDDDPRLHYLLVKAYQQLQDFDAAQAATGRLLELAPKDPEALRIAAAIATVRGDGPAAEQYLRTALEAIDAPLLRSALAENLFRQGRLVEAAAEMEKLPASAQASEPMQMLAGAVALRAGDLDTARTHYEAAYAATAATRNVLALAGLDWRARRQREALARLVDWLRENPADAIALNQLATYQLALGETDAATGSYERLLEQAPDSVVALNNLAWLYRASDTEKALAFVERALSAAPDVAPILDTKAMILHHAGRSSEALRTIDNALAAGAENNPFFLLNKARILAGLGRGDEARAIVAALPESGPPDYNRDRAALQRELATG